MKHDLHYVEEIFSTDAGIIGRFLPIHKIQPNPDQPRHVIGDLTELKASIQEKGVLEPIIVRPTADGYQIIAGERRWRACVELGLHQVPCIERDADDREVLELALIENLQRKDLSAFEEAEGLKSLADKYNYTHAEIAQVIGKSRTSVTESLSLIQIPVEVREQCRQADINSKSLLLQVVRQPDIDEMMKLVRRIAAGGLKRKEVREQSTYKHKPKPYVFHANGPGYKLIIHFNKHKVNNDEVVQILTDTLDKLK